MDAATTNRVDAANRELVTKFEGPQLEYHTTVQAEGVSDRLWLFLLGSADPKAATALTRQIQQHIAQLAPLKLKRQVNLPTPLLSPPVGKGHKLDIGLHVVNDQWNGALMLFLYYEGRFYNPPHLQLHDMRRFTQLAATLWAQAACSCFRSSDHCPDGCWECFKLSCDSCRGTGWKHFAHWLANGPRIDYRSGWPIAVLGSAA